MTGAEKQQRSPGQSLANRGTSFNRRPGLRDVLHIMSCELARFASPCPQNHQSLPAGFQRGNEVADPGAGVITKTYPPWYRLRPASGTRCVPRRTTGARPNCPIVAPGVGLSLTAVGDSKGSAGTHPGMIRAGPVADHAHREGSDDDVTVKPLMDSSPLLNHDDTATPGTNALATRQCSGQPDFVRSMCCRAGSRHRARRACYRHEDLSPLRRRP